MRRFVFAVLPLALAALTIYLVKPSDEECKEEAIRKLASVNVAASSENILIKDYFFMKQLRYVNQQDTFKLGTAAFLQVRIKDEHLQNIKTKNKQ